MLIIGTEVNGSVRWLRLGPFNIQPSEFAKLSLVLFIASYLLRRQKEVIDTIKGFIKPLIVLSLLASLLLLQPDLGSIVVIVVVMMGMLFIANARLISFVAITVSLLNCLASKLPSSHNHRQTRDRKIFIALLCKIEFSEEIVSITFSITFF